MCRYSKAFLAGTSSNLSGVVEIDEFAVMCCICVVYVQPAGIEYHLQLALTCVLSRDAPC